MLDSRSSDRRDEAGRRTGMDRRMTAVPVSFERRSGIDRRSVEDRRSGRDRRQEAFLLSQLM